jgi:hypothetical protein
MIEPKNYVKYGSHTLGFNLRINYFFGAEKLNYIQ